MAGQLTPQFLAALASKTCPILERINPLSLELFGYKEGIDYLAYSSEAELLHHCRRVKCDEGYRVDIATNGLLRSRKALCSIHDDKLRLVGNPIGRTELRIDRKMGIQYTDEQILLYEYIQQGYNMADWRATKKEDLVAIARNAAILHEVIDDFPALIC